MARAGKPGRPGKPGPWALLWREAGRKAVAGSVLAAVLSGGCSLQEWYRNGLKVGPNYHRPPAPVAPEWIDCGDPKIRCEPADLSAWWTVFEDPNLDSLIDTATRQNLTLRVAGARILEARALRDVARGTLFPQFQQAAGGYDRNKISSKVANAPPNQWFQSWGAGFNASWELDFWGRYRRLIETANANLDASIEGYDDALVILLSDVAANYIQLRTFQWRLYYAWQNVLSQTRQYGLAEDKRRLGAADELGVYQIETILETTKSTIPPLEAGERQANNRLCVLLGLPPRELEELGVGTYARHLREEAERLEARLKPSVGGMGGEEPPITREKLRSLLEGLPKPSRFPSIPPEVVVGIPADLVRRRPDVRQAERRMASQSALIGVTKADLYPRITLNGSIGLSAEHFGDLFDTPEAMVGSVGPAFQWNILNYGRILNLVRAQDARFQQSVYEYQNLVLRAGREAEDAIVGFLRTQQSVRNLEKSVTAARRTVEISEAQFQFGAKDLTASSIFQGILAQQQDAFARTRGEVALRLVEIYRALGGGWEVRFVRDGCAPPPAQGVAAHPPAPPPAQGVAAHPPAPPPATPDGEAPPEILGPPHPVPSPEVSFSGPRPTLQWLHQYPHEPGQEGRGCR
jgi:outer membrane protein TolC